MLRRLRSSFRSKTVFDELLAATYKFDDAQETQRARVGQHLRAIFLVQRWTGLRVGDVLILPKSALNGNRLTAIIRRKRHRKPKASVIERVLPDHVVKALKELPAQRGAPGLFLLVANEH